MYRPELTFASQVRNLNTNMALKQPLRFPWENPPKRSSSISPPVLRPTPPAAIADIDFVKRDAVSTAPASATTSNYGKAEYGQQSASSSSVRPHLTRCNCGLSSIRADTFTLPISPPKKPTLRPQTDVCPETDEIPLLDLARLTCPSAPRLTSQEYPLAVPSLDLESVDSVSRLGGEDWYERRALETERVTSVDPERFKPSE
ncbi:hypothetical protein H2203_002519 [Taxawa tesnikishii (nom. ined.)]|nr:hypothetical protein H2203_002519 [Dothideales sp. JES 119]